MSPLFTGSRLGFGVGSGLVGGGSGGGEANPIAALSPTLWYDFSDQTTVTTSGGQITQITDKGTRGWTLTKSSTGPDYVTGINGLKCVDWGSTPHSNYLRNTDTTPTNIAEAYIILDSSFNAGQFPSYNGLIGATSDPGFNLTGVQGYWFFYTSGDFDSAYVNGSATNRYNNIISLIESPCLLRVKRDNNTAISTVKGFQIGMDRNNGGRGWYGLIGEVVVFSSVLGTTDRTNVQNWLATKWGLTLVP